MFFLRRLLGILGIGSGHIEKTSKVNGPFRSSLAIFYSIRDSNVRVLLEVCTVVLLEAN